MRTFATVLAMVVMVCAAPVGADEPDPQIMCFKSGESRDRMYKTCFYRCPGGTVAITVKGYELCPLTVDR